MVQSWKGCVPKGTGGSNPPLSVFQDSFDESRCYARSHYPTPSGSEESSGRQLISVPQFTWALQRGLFFISKGLATFFRLEWCRGILPTVVSVSPNIALLGFCSLQYLLTVLSLFFTCQCVKHCHASYSTPQCLWNSYSSLLRMTYPSTSFIFRQTYTRTYPGNRLP